MKRMALRQLENLGRIGIDSYVNEVRKVWHTIHPRRTVSDYALHVLDHASKLGEAIRQDNAKMILEEAAETANWLFGFVAKLNDKKSDWEQCLNIEAKLSDMIWRKYPNLCPHCFERLFIYKIHVLKQNETKKLPEQIAQKINGKCKLCLSAYPEVEKRRNDPVYQQLKGKADKALKFYANNRKENKPEPLKKTEEMLCSIYTSNVAILTLETIGFHLLEEAGELGRAVIDIYTTKDSEGISLEEKRQGLCDEVAEVFAWECSLIQKIRGQAKVFDEWREQLVKRRLPEPNNLETILDKDIGFEQILWLKYREDDRHKYSCPYCRQYAKSDYCECTPTFAWEPNSQDKMTGKGSTEGKSRAMINIPSSTNGQQPTRLPRETDHQRPPLL